MNAFVYRLTDAKGFVYREGNFAIHKQVCVLQNNHKLLPAIVQLFVAQFTGNLAALDSESRPVGSAKCKLNISRLSIYENHELANDNQQLTVRTKATRADLPAFGLYKAAFNCLEIEGVSQQARFNETAIHQMRLLTKERSVKKLNEGEQ